MTMLGIMADSYNAPADDLPMAGLQVWLDADDASTFSYSSGAVVSEWRDKSGNNYHFSNSDITKQPLRTGEQNGLTTVLFDGVNSYLDSSVFTLDQPMTIFLAADLNSSGDPQGLTSNSTGAIQLVMYGGVLYVYAGNYPELSGSSYGIHSFSLIINGTLSKYYRDTALKGIGDPGTGNTATGFRLARGPGGESLKGEVFEVLIYNQALSNSDRTLVENYLMGKWNIPVDSGNGGGGMPTNRLIGWYDASDESTITLVDTDKVSEWRDKSPSLVNYGQTNLGLRPKLEPGISNGLSAIYFGPSPTQLYSGSATLEIFTYVFVFKIDISAIRTLKGQYFFTEEGQRGIHIRIDGTGKLQLCATGYTDSVVIASSIASVLNLVTTLGIITYTSYDGNFAFYINGNADNSGNVAPATFFPQSLIGNVNPANQYCVGHVMEIIEYNRVLTTTERQDLESILMPKWGITP